MKKKFLSILLMLSMVLAMVPASAFAETTPTVDNGEEIVDGNSGNDEEEIVNENGGNEADENIEEEETEDAYGISTFASGHQHCICGSTHKELGDHTESNKVDFVAWNKVDSLPTAEDVVANGKYFYLTKDVTLTDTWKVPADDMVLCLNGKTIIGSGYISEDDKSAHINRYLPIIVITGDTTTKKGYTFTLTNCQSTGGITVKEGTTVGGAVEMAGHGIYSYYGDYENVTFNMYNARIYNITDSGVLVGYAAKFNMYGGEITGNSYTGGVNTNGAFGLGVNIKKDATVNIAGGTISNNTAIGADSNSAFGGGIYNAGKLTITDGAHITGNKSSHYGGGIYNAIDQDSYTGECIITDSYIENNTAPYGGGIYNASDVYAEPVRTGAKLTIKGTTISGNVAESQSSERAAGGGIYIGEDYGVNPVTIENCTISGNTSKGTATKDFAVEKRGGGGIYTEGTLNIKNSKIINNISTGTYTGGAGILCYNTGNVSLDGCTVNGNQCTGTGSQGGGILYYNFSTYKYANKLSLKNTTIKNNSAMLNGGGVLIDRPKITQHLTLDGKVTITDNTCGGDVTASNLLLRDGWLTEDPYGTLSAVATIGDSFDVASSIGVSTVDAIAAGSAKDITDGYYTANYKDCFTSDDANYEIIADKNDEGAYKVQMKSPTPKYNVTINLGDYTEVATDDTYIGTATQSVEEGSAMESIKVVPKQGYYFPDDYSLDGVNGVTVTQHHAEGKSNIGTWLEISGTPTDDTDITLTDPTEARKVSELAAETYVYDGTAKTPVLKSGKQDGDVITGDSYTNAGTYKMKVTSATVFDNDSYEAEVEWKIRKRPTYTNTIAHGNLDLFKPVFEEEFIKGNQDTYYSTTYTGNPKTVGIELADDITGGGEITLWYKECKNDGTYGAYTKEAPTKVGTYRVAITMTEGSNFEAKTTQWDVIQFEIKGGTQAPPTGITAVGPTVENGKGKLVGTTTDMEYRASWWDGYTKTCTEGSTEVDVYGDAYNNTYWVRYKATDTLSASDWFVVTVPAYKPPLTGTVAISGTVKYKETLTATVTDVNASNLIYTWKRCDASAAEGVGEVIEGATGNTYTLTADDIGKKIFVEITSTEKNGILRAYTDTTVAKLPLDDTITDAITATGYTGQYDGKEHTIKVEGVPAGTIISYGENEGTYNLTEAPKYKDVKTDGNGERTVYFKVSVAGYEDYTGSAIVKITPAPVTIKINNVTKKVGTADPAFTAMVTGVPDGEELHYTLRRATSDEDKNDVNDVITIEADYTSNSNYAVTVENGTLTITEKEPQTITFAESNVTANFGDTVTNKLSGAQTTVAFESSNEDVARVDAATGEVTAVGVGMAIITAKAAATADYAEATASYQITVKYKVTLAGGGTDAVGAGSYDENDIVTIKAGTRSGYSFTGWTADSEAVVFADASSNETTFTMPAGNVTVTANWQMNSTSSSGGSKKPAVKDTIKNGDTITGKNLDNLVTGNKNLTVTDENGTKLVISKDALKDIDAKATGDIAISVKKVSENDGKTTYRVAITSDGETVTSVKGGMKLSLPYELKDGETEKDVKVWSVTEDGTKTEIPCSYDKASGLATFTVESINDFTVGTDEVKEPVKEPDQWVNPFTDVANGIWYTDAIEWASKNGVTSGLTDTVFGINGNCTRAQIVTFLWRVAGSPEPKTTENPFVDVTADQYYAKAVLWAVENGITSGVSDTTFAPDATCTRAQAVSFLYRAFGSPEAEGNSFTDVTDKDYYAKAVAWAVKNGITAGIGDGLFGPDYFCTRSQIVTFLYNAYAGK